MSVISMGYAIDGVLGRTAGALFVLGSIVLAVGCAAKPPELAGKVETPAEYSLSGDRELMDEWWLDFDDPGLNSAIATALESNPDLLAVWDRLAQAEAIARREGAPLYPSLNINGSAARIDERTGGVSTDREDYSLGAAMSYELDIWGRLKAASDAARFDLEAGERGVQTAAISLTASLATAWYQWADQLAQTKLLEEQHQINADLLELVKERFRQGQVQAVDVLRQQQLVQATEGRLRQANLQSAVLRHQVAVLMGRQPRAEITAPSSDLIELPGLPATGVPSELLERRPDVKSAFWGVASADRRLASAVANQYPRISIAYSVDTSAAETRDLFDNWVRNLAANLVHPLFEGGSLRAEVARNEALVSEALHVYSQTVLTAFQEVEDALQSEAHQKEYLESLSEQLATAESVINRTKSSYLNGQLDYLDVLAAITSRQDLERTYLTARRDLIIYRIQLHRALAGSLPLNRPSLATTDPVENISESPEIDEATSN